MEFHHSPTPTNDFDDSPTHTTSPKLVKVTYSLSVVKKSCYKKSQGGCNHPPFWGRGLNDR